MKTLALKLWQDEAGFLVSAEMVLISTIVVLGMVVGLAEVSSAINQELEDVASAFGSVNQSYRYSGLWSDDKAASGGSQFDDDRDFCDSQYDIAGRGSSDEGDYNY